MDCSKGFTRCKSVPHPVYRCPLCCSLEFLTKEDFHRHLTSVVAIINDLQCNECQQGFPSLQEYTEHLLVDCQTVEESTVDCDIIVIKQEQAGCIQQMIVDNASFQPAKKVEFRQDEVQEKPSRKCNFIAPGKVMASSSKIQPQQLSSTDKKGKIKKKQTIAKTVEKRKKNVTNAQAAEAATSDDDEFNSWFVHTEPTTGRQSKMPSSFCCEYCGKIFKRNDDYIKHVRVHTGEKPCVCVVCNKRFRVMSGLTLHMRTHTNERPYACTICPHKFKSHSQLDFHLKSHSDERNYQCPYCEKKFKTVSILAAHKRHHFKLVECDLCQRTFATNNLLKKHHRLVHSETGQEFKCAVCGFAFGKAWILENHLKSHSEPDLENGNSDVPISENNVNPLEYSMDAIILEPVTTKRVRKQKLLMDM